MALRDVRIDFIDLSGRYDLVVDSTDYLNNGADKYIQRGQRWLDREFEIARSYSRYYANLAINDWYALVPDCRTIDEVWMSNSAENKWKLDPLDLDKLREKGPKDPALQTAGKAAWWSLTSLRTIPEIANLLTVDKFGTTEYTVSSNHYSYLGLVWLPPIDQVTTLEVIGTFYQPKLNVDGDMNYWTEEEPQSLALAACRALEQTYRNTQGMMDYESAIRRELQGLEFDFVQQQTTGVTHMEGKM